MSCAVRKTFPPLHGTFSQRTEIHGERKNRIIFNLIMLLKFLKIKPSLCGKSW